MQPGLTLSQIPEQQIKQRLKSGLALRTGPFTVRINSRLPSVAEGVATTYADFPLADTTAFVDFHVTLAPPHPVRNWIRPQVQFYFDAHPPFTPLPQAQAYPLLEWGLNWCVSTQAHQFLILHAAVLEKNGYALIMPGEPGSGKSTLTAALCNRGWRLLSDEMTIIDPQNGLIQPLPRPVSLKNQAINIISQYLPGATLTPPVHDTLKGTVSLMKPPGEAVARMGETAIPRWVVFPKYRADGNLAFTAMSRGQAFLELARNAFNYSILGELGFHTLTSLMSIATARRFEYGGDLDRAVEAFASLAAEP